MRIAGILEFEDQEVLSYAVLGRRYRELHSLYFFQKGFETMEDA